MEVYVDNIIVKTWVATDYLKDLKETFDRLRYYNMKLNRQNSMFRTTMGKFLDFMISRCGVEANLEKIKAVLEMQPSSSMKDVQWLAGRVASSGRFVSKSVDKCFEFFKIP